MATVPYLAPGDEREAINWEPLFEEFDRKLSLALDNKTLLHLYTCRDEFDNLIVPRASYGRKFYFWGSSGTVPFFCSRWFDGEDGLVNYDHKIFNQAIAATDIFDSPQTWAESGVTVSPPATTFDDDRELVRLRFPVKSYYDAIGIDASEIPSNEFFNRSLEVHRKEFIDIDTPKTYRILLGQWTGAETTQWERPRLYENAEIILEGTTSIQILEQWNKYKFFRVHNLNNAPATILFRAHDGYALTVPAWGSRCIRIDDGEYTEGYNHFHKVLPGDARIFDGAATYPLNLALENCQSNNVFNPKIIWDICASLERRQAGPKMIIDPRLFWNAKEIYCNPAHEAASKFERTTPTGGYFGDPDSNATKLGDLFFHKGTVLKIKTEDAVTETQEIQFRGFNTISEDFSAASISVSEVEGELILTSDGDTVDLIGLSTNLISDARGLRMTAPAYQIQPPIIPTFEETSAGLGKITFPEFFPGDAATANETVTWAGNVVVGEAVTEFRTGTLSLPVYSKTNSSFSSFVLGSPAFDKFFKYTETVADVKAYAANNTASTVTNKEVLFTGFGPIFTATISTTLNGRMHVFSGALWEDVNTMAGLDTLTEAIYTNEVNIRLNQACGTEGTLRTNLWPSWDLSHAAGLVLSTDAPRALYYNYPRNDQFYGLHISRTYPASIFNNTAGAVSLHPDFVPAFDQRPAGEATAKKIASAPEKTGISLLSPFSYLGNKFISLTKWLAGENFAAIGTSNTSDPEWYRVNRDLFLNGDTTTEGFFDRFPETIETYNNLASIVNSIAYVIPIDWDFVFPEFIGDQSGIGNFNMRHRDHYARIVTDAQRDFCAAMGIPIKTLTHFPTTYQTLKTEKNRFWRRNEDGISQVDGDNADALASDSFRYGEQDFNRDVNGLFLNQAWREILFGMTEGDSMPATFEWVKVRDVEAKATALGLKFYFQFPAVVGDIQLFDSTSFNYEPESPLLGEFYPAKFAAFIEDNDGEWIKDVQSFRIKPSTYDPSQGLGIYGFFEIGVDDEFLKRNTSGIYATQPLNVNDAFSHKIGFFNYAPEGTTFHVIRIPENTLTYETVLNGSERGGITPTLVTNPALGIPEQQTLDTPEDKDGRVLEPNTVCERLVFFIDNRVDATA